MATVIPPVGEPREIAPANGRSFTLAELQGIVGGYVELLWAPDGRIMFLNEDGKRLELPGNLAASALMRGRIALDDWIVGTVILCTAIEAGEDDNEPE